MIVELVLNGSEGEGRLIEVDGEGVETYVRTDGERAEVGARVGGMGVDRLDVSFVIGWSRR